MESLLLNRRGKEFKRVLQDNEIWYKTANETTIPDTNNNNPNGNNPYISHSAKQNPVISNSYNTVINGERWGILRYKYDITGLRKYSFYNRKDITEVILPKTCKTLTAYYLFFQCDNLLKISIPEGSQGLGNKAICRCHELREIYLPSTITTIPDESLAQCQKLVNADIQGVRTFGKYALDHSRSLVTIKFGNNITSFDEGAFHDSSNIKNIHITSLHAWCTASRYNNDAAPNNRETSLSTQQYHLILNGEEIMQLTIPNTVTSIAKYSFQYLKYITELVIPSSVTSIGAYAFRNCNRITSITLPDTITNIGSYAFFQCNASGMYIDHLPTNLVTIGSYSLSNTSVGNPNTTYREIPANVTTIGANAFRYNSDFCGNDKTIRILNTTSKITAGTTIFYDYTPTIEIPDVMIDVDGVQTSLYQLYLDDPNWNIYNLVKYDPA